MYKTPDSVLIPGLVTPLRIHPFLLHPKSILPQNSRHWFSLIFLVLYLTFFPPRHQRSHAKEFSRLVRKLVLRAADKFSNAYSGKNNSIAYQIGSQNQGTISGFLQVMSAWQDKFTNGQLGKLVDMMDTVLLSWSYPNCENCSIWEGKCEWLQCVTPCGKPNLNFSDTRGIHSGWFKTDLPNLCWQIVSSPAVIGTRFGISTFPCSEFLGGCMSGPYNIWCISPWKWTSVTSVTHIPFFGTPVTRHVYHSLTLQSHIIQCSMAYEMIYLLYYAK